MVNIRREPTLRHGTTDFYEIEKSMQDDWDAPEYMNWEHERPRNGPFVGLAKVRTDLKQMSWKHPQGVGIILSKVKNIVLKLDLGISVNIITLQGKIPCRENISKFRQMFSTKNNVSKLLKMFPTFKF